jgi:hypothetical protein
MKVIQELVAYFERRGRLTPAQVRKLVDQGLLAGDGPPTMVGLCDAAGATYYFRVTGAPTGSLWGTDVYTGDSSLAAAAVHAGLVKVDETAVVRVTVERPLSKYQGSTRNGVTSHDFGQYGTAYRLGGI